MRQFLSLGGGIQSTTLFLMSLHGEIDQPCEAAIFADTGWEKEGTYETIFFLRDYAADFGVPLYTVSNGNLREDIISDRIETTIPGYIRNKEGKTGFIQRRCTEIYKIKPIRAKIRELTNANHKSPIAQWIGISTDEISRMKPSRVKYIVSRFPLIEKRMSRKNCYEWLHKNGFTAPIRSSCIGCPYQSNSEWKTLSEKEIENVEEVENAAHQHFLNRTGIELYFHGKLEMIKDKPFGDNSAQLELDLKTEECEGGCFL